MQKCLHQAIGKDGCGDLHRLLPLGSNAGLVEQQGHEHPQPSATCLVLGWKQGLCGM